MQSSGATCKTYFCPRISRDFTSSECRLAGAFSIASGGTTFARIAEWASGNAVVTLGTEFLFPDGGSLRRYCVFPSEWCPSARCRLAAAPKRGGHHQALRASLRLRFSRNQGRHRKPLAVDWRCADLPVATEFFYGFTRQRQSLPVAFHQILAFATVTFGNRTLQFCEGAIARQNLRQMKKAICMTVLIRAARPHCGRFSPR